MSRLRLLLRCRGLSIVFLIHFCPLALASQKLLPFLKREDKTKHSYRRYLAMQTYTDNEHIATPLPLHMHTIMLQVFHQLTTEKSPGNENATQFSYPKHAILSTQYYTYAQVHLRIINTFK